MKMILKLNVLINRKTQRKLKDFEKKLELATIKERTAYACLEKLTKDYEKLKLDKEALENMVTYESIIWNRRLLYL